MLMSVLLVLTTVITSVQTPKEALPVAVTLDTSCWLMDTSVEVHMHECTHMHTRTHARTHTHTHTHSHMPTYVNTQEYHVNPGVEIRML